MNEKIEYAAPGAPSDGPKIYTIGTLRYTFYGICILFGLLLWNDIVLMVMEQVGSLFTYLWHDHGGTMVQSSAWGIVSFFATIWINPVVSTWSDRTRTRMGRRRPFLLFAAPPAAMFLALVPFMPDLGHWAMRFHLIAQLVHGKENQVVLPLLQICQILFGIFNTIILSIFSYYFWDVVPQAVLARFQAAISVASAAASFGWLHFLFGLGDNHLKVLVVSMAVFFVVMYLITIWRVKEGEYPPPEPRKSKGLAASTTEAVRSYVVDCLSDRKYLWIFAAFILVQVGNQRGPAAGWFLRYQLNMSLDIQGKMQSWTQPAIMILSFPFGWLVDRFKPSRMLVPWLVAWALTDLVSYFVLRGPWSLLICSLITGVTSLGYRLCVSTLTPEIYPREKLGQFCSCSATLQSIVCMGTILIVSWLGDHLGIGKWQFVYLWATVFHLLGAVCFTKVCYDLYRAEHAATLEPKCHVCGCSLVNSPAVCPECGTDLSSVAPDIVSGA